jgi:uncharacterized ion transporter superfamily protein YfcC
LIAGWLACVVYVMRYAAKVKKDPTLSIVADHRVEIETQFRQEPNADDEHLLSLSQKWVLVIFALTFAVMIWGVSSQGWWMAKMGGLFIFSAILIGVITRMGEKVFTDVFINGARDLLGVAIIIGIARGIVVVMDAGNMTDTILHFGEETLSGLSDVVFINVMFGLEVLMSFFVPSSSGLAVLTMPIMAPLADFAGVGRELVVTAFQSANGLVNLFNPTFAVVMGALAIGKVPYERWLRFIWPLLLILTFIIMGSLSVMALLA